MKGAQEYVSIGEMYNLSSVSRVFIGMGLDFLRVGWRFRGSWTDSSLEHEDILKNE